MVGLKIPGSLFLGEFSRSAEYVTETLFSGFTRQPSIVMLFQKNCGHSSDLRDKFVRFAGLGEKMWNTFSHRCNITGKAFADRAKNTEGYITIPALHTSKIAPV